MLFDISGLLSSLDRYRPSGDNSPGMEKGMH